jgi:hypothetical protein
MNYCKDGGWLVDTRPLSDDLSDYDIERLPLLGCNHIRCRECGAVVRTIANWRPRNMDLATQRAFLSEMPTLYATPDLTTSPRLDRSNILRFYLCKCTYYTENNWHPLIEPDREWSISVTDKWHCDGHPLIDLPHTFDGVVVTADQLVKVVDDALHGWLPPSAREEDKLHVRWLARLHGRLAGTPYAEVVARAVAERADDHDPAVRELAKKFFEVRPSERLV